MKRSAALVVVGLAATSIACPIRRPPIPAEFYPFRAELEAAVADTALAVMEGSPATQERLYAHLPDLAAILTTDSLLRTLEADSLLERLAGPVSAKLDATLGSEDTAGRVRAAFRNPDGQRQGVDAVVVGLGTALRRLRAAKGRDTKDRSGSHASPENPRLRTGTAPRHPRRGSPGRAVPCRRSCCWEWTRQP